ncbi:ABC transporter substrate-binding protein [Thalassospira profundimaris]|uniref:substrate-binding periplasmic protein n=1 Tax=Thalassospira profundimaris TaxID=502049 RepID=UPI000DEDA86A|nr:transporter substrate-binding domain-containing protein [Thalassospira profundimaris]
MTVLPWGIWLLRDPSGTRVLKERGISMVSGVYDAGSVRYGLARIAGAVSRFFLLLLLASVGLVFVPLRASADDCSTLLVSGNPDYPPYLWPDPANPAELIGANAEFIKMVGREIGVEMQVRHAGPWGRVQEELRRGNIDMIAGAFYTPAREEYMDYLRPAFQGTQTRIWTLNGFPRTLHRWQDLRGLDGVTVINNSFGPVFDNFADQNLKLQEIPTLSQSLRLLELGRADYLIYEDFPVAAFLARNNMTGIMAQPVRISAEDLFITLSRNSPCNTPEMRVRLSSAIRKLLEDGVMKRLLAGNIDRWGGLVN